MTLLKTADNYQNLPQGSHVHLFAILSSHQLDKKLYFQELLSWYLYEKSVFIGKKDTMGTLILRFKLLTCLQRITLLHVDDN